MSDVSTRLHNRVFVLLRQAFWKDIRCLNIWSRIVAGSLLSGVILLSCWVHFEINEKTLSANLLCLAIGQLYQDRFPAHLHHCGGGVTNGYRPPFEHR